MGCAYGNDGVNPRTLDGGMRQPDTDGGSSTSCEPACAGDQVCRDGACVAGGSDADGDGVPATTDCDDGDPAVGAMAERPCSSECGDGVERCTDGAWAECTAPLTCECAAGTAPRELDCEMCGTQRQVCLEGMWMNDGVCAGMGACTPGTVETGGACGCGTEERRCGADCSWGDWACVGAGAGECAPGDTDRETRACGNCSTGSQSRTRSCDAGTCSWGAWSAWSTCVGGGTCAPGDTRTGCDVSSTGAATGCGVEVCTSSCTWGGCQLAPGASCMSDGGTNFQCCAPSGGGSGWQFCNASTCQWYACESHTC